MAETNPYLALLQERPRGNWMDLLSNALLGVGSGISQASSSGQGWGAGIAPGLMLGNQMTAQAEHAAEQERMRRFQFGLQAQEWDEKRAERLRKEKELSVLAGQYAPTPGTTTPGITAPQSSPVKMGPDLVAAGTPVVNYLTAQHGFSPLAAATVAGNLYQESGFNPGASGDSGTAFGMAQWRLDRQDKLKAFAASQQKPVTDPQVQLDYLVTEMKGGDMGAQRAYALLQQATTPEQANAAMMHFFRPQGYTPANPTGGHGFQNRVQNTQALLQPGRPSDATYAPVPTLPDPDAAPALPAGPAPRPGLGPRATPAEPAPDSVPLAQGGGEGEVVLPRIGLPFPARPPAAAPPGSVPFPTVPVAPQAAPTTPSAPAPSTLGPPPQLNLPQEAVLSQAQAARLQAMVRAGKPDEARAEYRAILTTQQQEVQKRYEQTYDQWKHQQAQGEKDAWVPIDLKNPRNAQMFPNLDPTRQYQLNRVTGQITEVGTAPKDQFAVVPEAEAKAELGAAWQPGIVYQRNKNTGKLEIGRQGADTNVTVDLGGKAVNEIAKNRLQNYEDKTRPAAQGAVTEITSMHRVRQLLDSGAFTGMGAESKLWLAQLGEQFFGLSSDKATNTQALMGAAAERVLASIKTLGANPTDTDRQYLEKAKGGSVNFTEAGLRRIIEIGEQNARDVMKKHDAEVKRIRKLEGIKDLPDEFFQLDDAPDFATWNKTNPLKSPQAAPSNRPPLGSILGTP